MLETAMGSRRRGAGRWSESCAIFPEGALTPDGRNFKPSKPGIENDIEGSPAPFYSIAFSVGLWKSFSVAPVVRAFRQTCRGSSIAGF